MIGNKTVKFKYQLGVRVKDITCDFVGIITARMQFLNGCIQYTVTPRIKKEGERQDSWNLDEAQLVQVDKGIHEKEKPIRKKAPTGGPATRV